MTISIHPTAIIGNNVKLDEDVQIGPFCIIEGNVEIGRSTVLYNNVIIKSPENSFIKIGENNKIFSFAVIGTAPQDTKFKNEPSNVQIGNNNIIREYVTINGGSDTGNVLAKTKNITTIGNNCYLYISSHIAHDVYLEDNVTITNGVGISGHCKIGHNTIIGGLSGVHQFVNIGHNVMIGGACAIAHDIPHYAIVMVAETKVKTANIVGMKRAGFDNKEILEICKFYKDYTNPEYNTEKLTQIYANSENKKIQEILEFLCQKTKRSL